MTPFMNSLLSYAILMVIMAAIAGVGITVGICLRKRKDAKEALEAEAEVTSTETK